MKIILSKEFKIILTVLIVGALAISVYFYLGNYAIYVFGQLIIFILPLTILIYFFYKRHAASVKVNDGAVAGEEYSSERIQTDWKKRFRSFSVFPKAFTIFYIFLLAVFGLWCLSEQGLACLGFVILLYGIPLPFILWLTAFIMARFLKTTNPIFGIVIGVVVGIISFIGLSVFHVLRLFPMIYKIFRFSAH